MERRTSTGCVTVATISPFVDSQCDPIKEQENLITQAENEELFKFRRYPFATVLRLRVLQVVCGISSMIMGTVGLIEEKGEFNLGLGIPAGAVTVIAAGSSIHNSRGFSGYRPSTCLPGTWLSRLKFLGPSIAIATTLTLTWTLALIFHLTLSVIACQIILRGNWFTETEIPLSKTELEEENWNYRAQAVVLLVLSFLTVFTVLTLLRVDCLYDPD